MNEKRSVNDELEERLSAILAKATESERDLAVGLLSARKTAFGTSLIVLSGVALAVAGFFQPVAPGTTAIVFLMALALMIAGALHVDRCNRARRTLAEKFRRRMAKATAKSSRQ